VRYHTARYLSLRAEYLYLMKFVRNFSQKCMISFLEGEVGSIGFLYGVRLGLCLSRQARGTTAHDTRRRLKLLIDNNWEQYGQDQGY
jgi:hypothetical protein